MTAPLLKALVGIREADLRDTREVSRLDAFVRAQPDATPFHLTGWSRAVEQGCRQRARYLVAERRNDEVAGVLPLTEMRSRLFGRASEATFRRACLGLIAAAVILGLPVLDDVLR